MPRTCELCQLAQATRGTVCGGCFAKLLTALTDHLSKTHGDNDLDALCPTGNAFRADCTACRRAARILAAANWEPAHLAPMREV